MCPFWWPTLIQNLQKSAEAHIHRIADHSCFERSCCVQFIEVSLLLKINSCLDCFYWTSGRIFRTTKKLQWRFPRVDLDETKWIWGEERVYEPGTPEFTSYLSEFTENFRETSIECVGLLFKVYPPNSSYVRPQLYFRYCFDLPNSPKPGYPICLAGNADMIKATVVFDTTLTNLPVLHRVRIVKLLTQHVVKGDFWVPTNGSPPC